MSNSAPRTISTIEIVWQSRGAAVDAIDTNSNATCSRRRKGKKCDGRRPVQSRNRPDSSSSLSPPSISSVFNTDEMLGGDRLDEESGRFFD